MTNIVQDMDENITTAICDLGGDRFMAVVIEKPIQDVEKALKDGYVAGDSPLGEVHINSSVVKYLQVGKREVNSRAANRPSNLPL